MGTPEFAAEILKTLIEGGSCQVIGVVTAPDKPSGRGRRLAPSLVKAVALHYRLPVYQPTNLKAPGFIDELARLRIDVMVVVAFRMLPEAVWRLPSKGTFNLHASLLPDYRGAAPINWAIINGETKTGLTTFFIDEKIDTGAILLKKEVDIAPRDTAGSLHDKLMRLGAPLIAETLSLIARNQATPIKQEERPSLKTAPKIFKDTCKINWDCPVQKIYNHIRGLSPYPGAWTELHSGQEAPIPIKIYDAEPIEAVPGKPLGACEADKKQLRVYAKDGFLLLKEIQLPGKKPMPTADVLNGFHFPEGAFFR